MAYNGTVSKDHYDGASPLHKYLVKHMTPLSPHMIRLREATLTDPKKRMLSASDQQNFLQLFVATMGAKKTLDIGVYTGYSALSVALALPEDGKVVACDITDDWVNQYGRPVWKEAGVEGKIDLRIAPALDTLQSLIDGGEAGTFDFAFIDADKLNYPKYYELCLQLLRRGGIIAVDNQLWDGTVLKPEEEMQPDTKAIHQLNVTASTDPRVHASLLSLGDGVLFCRKL